MDLSFIEGFIPNIAEFFNVEPSTILLLWALIATASNVVTRLIPDTAIGWLGVVRKLTAVIGVYVPSRVAPGITTRDVAVDALETAVKAPRVKIPAEVKSYLEKIEVKQESTGEG